MSVRFVGMSMTLLKEIQITMSPPEPNGKMCPMIGNARFAVPARKILRKNNKFAKKRIYEMRLRRSIFIDQYIDI
jgi:hypothetical protein